MIYCSDFHKSNVKIRYGIFAQLLPLNVKDYIDSAKSISIFRGSKEIFLYRPPVSIPIDANLINTIETKVGGLMGLGGTKSVTQVIFDRN
jgi:hypothetical protein